MVCEAYCMQQPKELICKIVIFSWYIFSHKLKKYLILFCLLLQHLKSRIKHKTQEKKVIWVVNSTTKIELSSHNIIICEVVKLFNKLQINIKLMYLWFIMFLCQYFTNLLRDYHI
jgi:hypothetical protein